LDIQAKKIKYPNTQRRCLPAGSAMMIGAGSYLADLVGRHCNIKINN